MSQPVPDEVILGLLKAQPSHGYDLLDRFHSKEHLGRMWRMSTSQIYSVLKRLEDSGEIQGFSVEVDDAPTRREFQILPAGELHLNKWLYEQQPSASLHRIRVIFLSRLYIALILDKPADKIIQNQMDACKKQLSDFLSEQQEIDSRIEFMAIDLVINQLSAVINWLEGYKKKFSENYGQVEI